MLNSEQIVLYRVVLIKLDNKSGFDHVHWPDCQLKRIIQLQCIKALA